MQNNQPKETHETLIDYLLGPPPHGPYPKLNARELVDVMPIEKPWGFIKEAFRLHNEEIKRKKIIRDYLLVVKLLKYGY